MQGFTKFGPVADSGLPAILTYDGPTGEPRPLDAILKELHRLKDGDIAYGHLHAHPEVKAVLTRKGMATYFIFRDPRDVCVSHVHYLAEMAPDHAHHHYFAHELTSFNERLKVSILGRPTLDIPFPDIRGRFEPYFGWLESPEVLALRFEEFIEEKTATLRRILNHAEKNGLRVNIPRKQALQLL